LKWRYAIHAYFDDFRPFEPGTTIETEDIQATEDITVADTVRLRDSLLCEKFVTTAYRTSGIFSTAESYYRTVGSHLERVAGRGSDFALPKQVSGITYNIHGVSFHDFRDLVANAEHAFSNPGAFSSGEITFFDPPQKVLEYPLAVGNSWIVSPGPYVVITKKVVDIDTVQVPAGTFRAATVSVYYDFNNSGTLDSSVVYLDEIAPQGLVRRTIMLQDVIVSSPSKPEGIGLIDFHSECVLVSRDAE
jgi:hypothetical protein